jgi:superfamily II DNA or RNA helicase
VSEEVWSWWPEGRRVVRELDRQDVFDHLTVEAYSPATGEVQALDVNELARLAERDWTAAELEERLLTLRVLAEAGTSNPIAASAHVNLLPHQLAILQRALRLSPVRLAVCCEVGLGKTTTAGAIATELLARGRARRVLVVAPKGVQLQWVAEMRDKFAREFTRLGPEGVPIDAAASVWNSVDLAVTSLDAIKPLRRRSGWSQKQIKEYNAARMQGVISAGWDLVIIDEAHHVAGSSEDVARYQLAKGLADAAENLLLLTATPHSGKSESFRRFLGLLDPSFQAGREITTAAVGAVIARTDKRGAVDNAGRALFHPRTTHLELVGWEQHPLHRALYEEVTEYVREGFLKAQASGNTARGFLMLLFQRLVASSSAAILSALDRRLASLVTAGDDAQPGWDELEEAEAEALLLPESQDATALRALVGLARQTVSGETDPKTLHFLRLLAMLQRAERNPTVKVLIFTQFRATQRALVKVLESQGITTASVDGSMGLAERAAAQAAFRADAQVLVSTDAGGEGVNLQFAHLVVNWDLPWTPTLLEQRIGRVDRIGQSTPVQAYNLVLDDSVDQRVLEVLEEKLAIILAELGVDKRNDVLASVDDLTDSLYVTAIIEPERLRTAGENLVSAVQASLAEGSEAQEILAALAVAPPPSPASPVPDLVRRLEKLTGAHSGEALRSRAVIVPGEPVPALSIGAGPGWLAVGRALAGTGGSSTAFAVFVHDSGRSDPRRGRELLSRLTNEPFSDPVAVTVLPPERHQALERVLLDYGYSALQELGRGTLPPRPQLRLALGIRCT